MKKYINKIILHAFLAIILLNSCSEKDLDPTLAQNKAVETSINTLEDLKGISLGMYNRITSSTYYGRDVIIYGEVRSDNAYSDGTSGRFVNVSDMLMTETDGNATDTWNQLYAVIATANIVIAAEVTGNTSEINHIKGQAYAVRALAHFDLVKLYGQQHVNGGGLNSLGVPYVKEFKGENLSPSRNTVGEVKEFIEDDFTMALSLMSASLNDSSKQYITTGAVNAFWSRVEIYFGDYPKALIAAKAVIDSQAYRILESSEFVSSWSTDSSANSIFELAVNGNDNNGINGLANIYRGSTYGDVVVLDNAKNIFDSNDIRLSSGMIGIQQGKLRNIGKYPSITFDDNINIIRYEEVVLNYAEALLQTNPATALTWLNQIPAKRNASPYTVANMSNILLERRKELMFEGFRFDDLVRTKSNIPFLNPLQPGPAYGSTNLAFPIPQRETDSNPNMVQNAGYAN